MNNNSIIDINHTLEFKPFPEDMARFLNVSNTRFVGFAFKRFKLVFTFEPYPSRLTKCDALNSFECSARFARWFT